MYFGGVEKKSDIIIVGAGLAGLTAGIHLAKNGFSVTIIEKNEFPKHKVCGEYISNEVLHYCNYLDLDLKSLKVTNINKLEFSIVDGTSIATKLPLGGFGISRYNLDYYLYQKAMSLGCNFIHEEVKDITFLENNFTITAANEQQCQSKIVLGAFGKRSNLDINLERDFIQKKSPWLAVKAHYKVDFPNDLVGLHNFDGGYCGVSKVENNQVNICYLTQYKSFKKYKNIDDFQEYIVTRNPKLKAIFEKSTLLFEKPLTISQISFEAKKAVENHIIMIGDSAGLIHPLCGNGMAMAMHSAKIASELSIALLQEKIGRTDFEKQYQDKWNKTFKSRIRLGKWLSKLLLKPTISKILMKIMVLFPFSLSLLIQKTHGKPF
jgi:flavin-dependent dehydrogenase